MSILFQDWAWRGGVSDGLISDFEMLQLHSMKKFATLALT